MLTVGEWLDKTEEIANELEKAADTLCTKEINRAKAYREGYIQACEDFNKQIICAISQNQG